MNDKTTKPETAAEVLAEMRDRTYRRFYTKAREWADRIERALSAQGEAVAAHPDDIAVDRFAEAMKEKLAAARAKGRGGWDDKEDLECHLSNLLRAHVEKGDPRDVANFCCFLWNRGESIQPAPARVTEDDGRQAFEKWAAKRWALSLERWHDSGEYKSGLTRDWWQCWTESRAALTAALEADHG